MMLYNTIRGIAAVALLILATACSSPKGDAPDYIFYNASVHTMDESVPTAEAVAITNKTIEAVGDDESILSLAGPETRLLNLDGQMMLPGFIDAHMHPISGGGYAKALSLETWGTVEQWIEAIGEYARANPDRGILFGYGFLATTFGPEGPLRQQIDAVVPDRPVLIMDEGFHAAWANTAALEALNITQDTPDPVANFSYYKRDADGNATGYLLEGTAGMAMQALDVLSEDVIIDGTAYVFDRMNAYGVTSAFDAGVISAGGEAHSILETLEKGGDMSVRLVGTYRPGGPDDVAMAAANADRWRREVKGERYHYRMLKIMNDGTVEGRTAAMFEDYQGEPGNAGETVYTQDELTKMVTEAAALNIDVHIHALGERAIHEALNAIEAARARHGDSDSRYAICHIQVITDEDLPRFAELDVIAQSTPLWASYDTYGEQFVSEDQFKRFWRFRSLRDLGVKLTFGSDYPASGAGLLGISPVFNTEIGITRQEPGAPDGPVQPRETERLDVASMLRGYTIDAAWQLHMEDEIGSIVAGKKADLVVLDKDLFDVDTYDLHKVNVTMTVMDGEIVYDSTGDTE